MFRFILLLILLVLSTASCRKKIDYGGDDFISDQIVVPAGFEWKTIREIRVVIHRSGIPDPPDLLSRLDLFHGTSTGSDRKLASGSAGTGNPCRLTLQVPVIMQEIRVMFRPVSGVPVTVTLPVADTVTYSFTETGGGPAVEDSDGDKVPDHLDDFPADPALAFISHFPDTDENATLLFEDIWPYKGDYDLNDLVVQFQILTLGHASNRTAGIRIRYLIQAVGAGLRDGFGIQIDDLDPMQTASVTGSSLTQGYVNLHPRGFEINQHSLVAILFDRTDNLLHNPPSAGNFFNTWPGSERGWSDTLTLAIQFLTPLLPDSLPSIPFNFFLIQDLTRGTEIHMANERPTNLANLTLFGTADDDSDPATGRYYISRLNIPWAILVPARMPHTSERFELAEAYLKFEDWAVSGGKDYGDWYTDKPGYRDPSKLFP